MPRYEFKISPESLFKLHDESPEQQTTLDYLSVVMRKHYFDAKPSSIFHLAQPMSPSVQTMVSSLWPAKPPDAYPYQPETKIATAVQGTHRPRVMHYDALYYDDVWSDILSIAPLYKAYLNSMLEAFCEMCERAKLPIHVERQKQVMLSFRQKIEYDKDTPPISYAHFNMRSRLLNPYVLQQDPWDVLKNTRYLWVANFGMFLANAPSQEHPVLNLEEIERYYSRFHVPAPEVVCAFIATVKENNVKHAPLPYLYEVLGHFMPELLQMNNWIGALHNANQVLSHEQYYTYMCEMFAMALPARNLLVHNLARESYLMLPHLHSLQQPLIRMSVLLEIIPEQDKLLVQGHINEMTTVVACFKNFIQDCKSNTGNYERGRLQMQEAFDNILVETMGKPEDKRREEMVAGCLRLINPEIVDLGRKIWVAMGFDRSRVLVDNMYQCVYYTLYMLYATHNFPITWCRAIQTLHTSFFAAMKQPLAAMRDTCQFYKTVPYVRITRFEQEIENIQLWTTYSRDLCSWLYAILEQLPVAQTPQAQAMFGAKHKLVYLEFLRFMVAEHDDFQRLSAFIEDFWCARNLFSETKAKNNQLKPIDVISEGNYRARKTNWVSDEDLDALRTDLAQPQPFYTRFSSLIALWVGQREIEREETKDEQEEDENAVTSFHQAVCCYAAAKTALFSRFLSLHVNLYNRVPLPSDLQDPWKVMHEWVLRVRNIPVTSILVPSIDWVPYATYFQPAPTKYSKRDCLRRREYGTIQAPNTVLLRYATAPNAGVEVPSTGEGVVAVYDMLVSDMAGTGKEEKVHLSAARREELEKSIADVQSRRQFTAVYQTNRQVLTPNQSLLLNEQPPVPDTTVTAASESQPCVFSLFSFFSAMPRQVNALMLQHDLRQQVPRQVEVKTEIEGIHLPVTTKVINPGERATEKDDSFEELIYFARMHASTEEQQSAMKQTARACQFWKLATVSARPSELVRQAHTVYKAVYQQRTVRAVEKADFEWTANCFAKVAMYPPQSDNYVFFDYMARTNYGAQLVNVPTMTQCERYYSRFHAPPGEVVLAFLRQVEGRDVHLPYLYELLGHFMPELLQHVDVTTLLYMKRHTMSPRILYEAITQGFQLSLPARNLLVHCVFREDRVITPHLEQVYEQLVHLYGLVLCKAEFPSLDQLQVCRDAMLVLSTWFSRYTDKALHNPTFERAAKQRCNYLCETYRKIKAVPSLLTKEFQKLFSDALAELQKRCVYNMAIDQVRVLLDNAYQVAYYCVYLQYATHLLDPSWTVHVRTVAADLEKVLDILAAKATEAQLVYSTQSPISLPETDPLKMWILESCNCIYRLAELVSDFTSMVRASEDTSEYGVFFHCKSKVIFLLLQYIVNEHDHFQRLSALIEDEWYDPEEVDDDAEPDRLQLKPIAVVDDKLRLSKSRLGRYLKTVRNPLNWYYHFAALASSLREFRTISSLPATLRFITGFRNYHFCKLNVFEQFDTAFVGHYQQEFISSLTGTPQRYFTFVGPVRLTALEIFRWLDTPMGEMRFIDSFGDFYNEMLAWYDVKIHRDVLRLRWYHLGEDKEKQLPYELTLNAIAELENGTLITWAFEHPLLRRIKATATIESIRSTEKKDFVAVVQPSGTPGGFDRFFSVGHRMNENSTHKSNAVGDQPLYALNFCRTLEGSIRKQSVPPKSVEVKQETAVSAAAAARPPVVYKPSTSNKKKKKNKNKKKK
jgi:hypothetical protein